jgi:bifunctional non-homologous end joining protein LigD
MLDQKIAPMLARSSDPFDSPEFIYEVKWDGMRCILLAEDKTVRLQNRRMIDVSVRYPEITALRKQIKAENAILDGELVVLTGGKPDFYKLQSRFHLQNRPKIDWFAAKVPVTFVVFDLLYLNGESCLNVPLYRRKEMIEGIIEKSSRMIISRPFSGSGIKMFEEVCRRDLEGIVAKRFDSPYLIGRRSENWLKIKAKHSLTCHIAGLKIKVGIPGECIEALVLAEKSGSELSYCGHVMSGLSDAELVAIRKKLADLKSDCPCIPNAKGWKSVRWVKPELKCKVIYNERTPSGCLRAPVFQNLID